MSDLVITQVHSLSLEPGTCVMGCPKGSFLEEETVWPLHKGQSWLPAFPAVTVKCDRHNVDTQTDLTGGVSGKF